MEIFTDTCPACGTIVAANELEDRRVMKCPGIDCDAVLQWENLSTEERDYFMEHRSKYRI